MSKKVNKDIEEMKSFSVKLSNLDLDEKVLVNSWLQELKNNKKSINSALQNILIEYLREKSLNDTFHKFQSSIFYAFRKSIFASLSPFHSNIKHWFNLQNIEIEIINKKLDLVLNLLAKSGNLNLHSPKEEFLNELDHFKIVRKNETIELMLNKKKEDEKIKETVKTFERFQKVAFDTEEDVANKISKLEQGESDEI